MLADHMSDSAIDYKDTLFSAENRFYLNSVKERTHSYSNGFTGFCSRLD